MDARKAVFLASALVLMPISAFSAVNAPVPGCVSAEDLKALERAEDESRADFVATLSNLMDANRCFVIRPADDVVVLNRGNWFSPAKIIWQGREDPLFVDRNALN